MSGITKGALWGGIAAAGLNTAIDLADAVDTWYHVSQVSGIAAGVLGGCAGARVLEHAEDMMFVGPAASCRGIGIAAAGIAGGAYAQHKMSSTDVPAHYLVGHTVGTYTKSIQDAGTYAWQLDQAKADADPVSGIALSAAVLTSYGLGKFGLKTFGAFFRR